jgi:hypothetical protein
MSRHLSFQCPQCGAPQRLPDEPCGICARKARMMDAKQRRKANSSGTCVRSVMLSGGRWFRRACRRGDGHFRSPARQASIA